MEECSGEKCLEEKVSILIFECKSVGNLLSSFENFEVWGGGCPSASFPQISSKGVTKYIFINSLGVKVSISFGFKALSLAFFKL